MTASNRPETAPPPYRSVVADGLPELDQRLSDELDLVNAAATEGVAPSRELTVLQRDLPLGGVPTPDQADVHFRKEL